MFNLGNYFEQIIGKRVLASLKKHIGEIQGLANIPVNGPLIIVANHRSYYDHLVVFFVLYLTRRGDVYFFTKQEAFDSFFSKKFHTYYNCIPVDREGIDVKAIKKGQEVLKKNNTLVIYPEGTRSQQKGLLPFKKGAFLLSVINKVPVLPIGIINSDGVLPKGGFITKKNQKVFINIGDVIHQKAGIKQNEQLDYLSMCAQDSIYRLITVFKENPKYNRKIAEFISHSLDHIIDADGNINKHNLYALRSYISYTSKENRENSDYLTQLSRLDGLYAKTKNKNIFVQLYYFLKIYFNCKTALKYDSNNSTAYYILSRIFNEIPTGLSKKKRLLYMNLFIECSDKNDTRPYRLLAEYYEEINDIDKAIESYNYILGNSSKDHARHEIRTNRAKNKIAFLKNRTMENINE